MRIGFALALVISSVSLSAEMRLELVRHSLTGAHCRYREYVNGIPSDVYEVRTCEADAFGITTETQALRPDASLRIIDGRVARREIMEERPLEPFAYDYDFETGALLRTVPLFFHAKPARVFDPNPVVATNDPTLRDRNDAATAVPEQAYRDVELLDVVSSGPLAGPHVKLVDRQTPAVAPPDAASPLLFDREAAGFEDVNVYFHIDRTQRYLQSLGYMGERSIAAYAIEADAHSANGSDNSFFLPSVTQIAVGTLHFGEGGTDDAEDADLIVHEYGHAIQEWIAPGTFGGSFTSESRALSEGFGDYWAYSTHSAQRLASGRDPFCLADWDARCWEDDASQLCTYPPGSDCLRRVDGTRTMAQYERVGGAGVEHRNGSIWSSALREIHQQLGRTITDTIVLEAMFAVPPNPTFAVMAQRILEADRLLFNGIHAQTICAAMLARGIVTGCDETHPRGEQTLFQSSDRALPIPENNSLGVTSSLTIGDTRAIERIFVRVDIAHPLRGDLRIELVAPDGTIVLLQQVSGERGPNIRTTFGLTATTVEPLDTLHGRSAAGLWKLIVRDLRPRDVGTLLSWGLVLQLEGDVPSSERPRGASAQMIPVVTHVLGVGGTRFVSDLRIANLYPATRGVTLVFTRSGEDGRTHFSAMNVTMAPGQTVAFDDVVDSVFHTAGSGSLEILGASVNVTEILVMSRTYAETAEGTLGQQVPPVAELTGIDEPPLALFPLPEEHSRYNIGLTETAGASGVVKVGEQEITIQPFSHVQFAGDSRFTEVSVVSGEARVAAYVSQISEHGDAMFIPARRLPDRFVVRSAPAISASPWHSDVWFSSAAMSRVILDALWTQFRQTYAVIDVYTDVLAGTRIRNGKTDQYVPLAGVPGLPYSQNLVFIETAPPYRTNIGIFNFNFHETIADVVVFDSAGVEVQRERLTTFDRIAQVPILPGIVRGRAFISFVTGEGYAFASLVDERTGDATYIEGQ
jgi:subtilisin-like proprotein convertase family protein